MSKHAIEYIVGSHPSFRDFRREVPELKDIPIPLFRKIIEECGQAFVERIIEDGDTIKLPRRLGELGLKGRKEPLFGNKFGTPFPLDMAKTARLGKDIYHECLHSDRYAYHITWDKKSAVFNNSDLWKFLGAQVNFRKKIMENILKGVEYEKKLM